MVKKKDLVYYRKIWYIDYEKKEIGLLIWNALKRNSGLLNLNGGRNVYRKMPQNRGDKNNKNMFAELCHKKLSLKLKKRKPKCW